MKIHFYCFACTCIAVFLSSCASVKPYYQDGSDISSFDFRKPDANDLDYSLYLTGGVPLASSSIVLDAIEKDRISKKSGLVLLGDVLSIDDLPSDANE